MSDADAHWYACTKCGEKQSVTNHYASCSAPGKCAECGAAYAGGSVRHDVIEAMCRSDETHHWTVCKDCGKEFYKSEHYAACTNTSQCVECGALYAGDTIGHSYDYTSYQKDETHHWNICSDCHEIVNKSLHIATCQNPTKCDLCGAAYSGSLLIHNVDQSNYQGDETHHWYVCKDCGQEALKAEHYADCTDPDKCVECGAAYAGENISHEIDTTHLESDESSHWSACKNCDKRVNECDHSAICTAPNVCAECGAAFAGSAVTHDINKDNPIYDETMHWFICTRCGKQTNLLAHYATCTNPTVCAECGIPYAGDNISHYFDWNDPQHDETNHWFVCLKCDARVEIDEHYASCGELGTCAVCGVAYAGENVRHSATDADRRSDQNGHWYECPGCQTKILPQPHINDCTDLTKCAECGVPYTGTEIRHNYTDEDQRYDESNHWYVCRACHQDTAHYPHRASCIDPTKCAACGAAYTGANVSHRFDFTKCEKDETTHWNVCMDCGIIENRGEHFAACQNPTVCQACGAAYAGDSILHSNIDHQMKSNETHHWYACKDCDGKVEVQEHTASCTDRTKCRTCGAAYAGGTISHNTGGIQHDETNHWFSCMDCGIKLEVHAHYASCENPTKCSFCGTAYSGDNITHKTDQDAYDSDATAHWYTCANCGADFSRGAHQASCKDPTKCATCGAAYTGSVILHEADRTTLLHDETTHWYPCADCGQKIEQFEHMAYCNRPTVCLICGADCSSTSYMHSFIRDVWLHDETGHWFACNNCSIQGGYNKHFATCEDPTKCAVCGVAYASDSISHDVDWNGPMLYNETDHWRVCRDCGQTIEISNHYADCTDPTKCAVCGVAYAGDSIAHDVDQNGPMLYDETNHWRVCRDCGQTFKLNNHCADCTDPTKCAVCGAAYAGDSISHDVDWGGPMLYDETDHWRVCKDCGQTFELNNHCADCTDPTKCAECGAAYAGENIAHDVDWNGPMLYNETDHWRVCKDCGQTFEINNHCADCTDPTKCNACGAAYAGENITHNIDWSQPQYNGVNHWFTCKDCHQKVNESVHTASCTEPTKCIGCGAPYTGSDLSHDVDWDDPKCDATNHWYVCAKCHNQVYMNKHNVSCRDLTKCAECGTAYTDDNVQHSISFEGLRYDENNHWHICDDCQEIVYFNEHYATCKYPTKCAECGVAYGGDNVSHCVDMDKAKYNADEHWYICEDCGEITQQSEHYASCLNPTKCAECGIAYSGDSVQHNVPFSSVQHDETNHWYICDDCHEIIDKNEHYAACKEPGKCAECGIAYDGGNVMHNIDWEHAQYDADEHWYACKDCDEIVDRGEHYVYCSDPTHCGACGVPYTSDTVNHVSGKENRGYDGDTHWSICTDCHEKYYPMIKTHYAKCTDPTHCLFCGADYSGVVSHYYDEDADAVAGYDGSTHWWTCKRCGIEDIENAVAHIPDPADPSICQKCGAAISEACAHDEIVDPAVAAGCKTDGLTQGSHCGLCGEILVEQQVVKATGHKYQMINRVAPTCESAGKSTYACSKCGARYDDVSAALGHDDTVTETPSACLKPGSRSTVCQRCGVTEITEIAALGHAFEVTETPPTCEEAGSRVSICAVCGLTETEELPALGHAFEVTETPPACEKVGSRVSVCAVCGLTETEELPALGHAYGAFVSQSDGTHAAACAVCSARLVKSCVMNETVAGNMIIRTCPVCGYTLTQVKEAPPPAPTDEEEGESDAPASASPLDRLIVKEVVTKEIEDVVIEVIPPAAPVETDPVENEDPAPAPLENAKITIHETTLVVEGEAPPVKLFNVGVTVEGENVALPGAIKIKIPCAEADGMKLVLLLPDGTVADVAYEIIDGVIVFETDIVGTFALIPAE